MDGGVQMSAEIIQPIEIVVEYTRADCRFRRTSEVKVCTAILTVKYAVATLPNCMNRAWAVQSGSLDVVQQTRTGKAVEDAPCCMYLWTRYGTPITPAALLNMLATRRQAA